jgi:F-type H+-transporting ATPase subunit b
MLLDLDIPTILFEIANFLVLSALLYYFLFRPVMSRVEERAAEKQRMAREMEEDREEAARLRADTEERLDQIEEEAREILSDAEQRMQRQRREIMEAVRREAERILEHARQEAGELKRQEIKEFSDELLDAVVKASSQLIGQAASDEMHDGLVEELNERVWEMGRGEMRQVEMLRRSLGERRPTVHVTAARPLGKEQQRDLVQTFGALADRTVSVELEIDSALAAGVRVRLGDMIVENSVAQQLEDLRDEIGAALRERLAVDGDSPDEEADE